MNPNWTLIIALSLILLKQLFKLYAFNKPDRIDVLKTVASLPVDVSFLIVSFIIKAAVNPASLNEIFFGLLLLYVIVSFLSTMLWRICEASANTRFGGHFLWAFPFNAAMTCTAFYVAFQYV